MTWYKVDDTFHGHPKPRRVSLAAVGLWTMAGSYSGQHLTDGFVPDWFVRQFPQGPKLARELVGTGLWNGGAERDQDKGFVFHDWSDYQPSAESVKARRRADVNRQKLARDPALRDAIRRRDGDRCRYCGQEVRFQDRRSPLGGTYDHVDPKGETSLDNCVVCCRGCNSYKGHRTPAEAGMTLLRPKSRPRTRPSSAPESDLVTEGVTPRTPTGRGGSGRGGPGRDGLDGLTESVDDDLQTEPWQDDDLPPELESHLYRDEDDPA